MAQRPTSEQFIPIPQSTPSHPNFGDVDGKSPSARPISEVYNKSSPEDEAIEKWFDDLTQYERTLEDMAKASLEPAFKDELGAVENWFSALSEAERTAALYSLIHQATKVQVRFFITVLQKMTKDPVYEALSPRPRSGLQTLSDFPNAARRKAFERHSMPISNPEQPSFSGKASKSPSVSRLSNRLSFKDSFESRTIQEVAEPGRPSWDRNLGASLRFSDSHVKGKKIPSIDVNAASTWGIDESGPGGMDRPKTASWHSRPQDGASIPRPRSATHNTDPDWGSLRDFNGAQKGRNPNNLTLKVDNVEIKIDSQHWPPSARLSGKSSAVPPGLFPVYSPVSWAATPTESAHVRTPLTPEPKSVAADDASKEPKPLDPVDFEVLESIPAWMRALRLHKYTSLFEHMTWREIIKLNDEQLSEIGVAALGARRKFLKVFEHVKAEAVVKDISLE